MFHDVIVEMERDALLYPFLNEPSGDSGNSLLLFGGALHNAELALLLAVSTQNVSMHDSSVCSPFLTRPKTTARDGWSQEALGLGWKAKRTILEMPLAHASLLVVSTDAATAVAPAEL